jgi:hypothetical protein
MTNGRSQPARVNSIGRRFRRRLAVVALVLGAGSPQLALAQTVEIAPLAGYRFGNDLFEVAAKHPIDDDGAPVAGVAIDVALGNGLSFEGVFSRQRASLSGEPHLVVDQYLAGGRQEFGDGLARPFLTGLLGFTRYAADGDNELRFAVSAGGGAHLALRRHLGVRLESRVFTTFVDADTRGGVCGPRGCLVGLHLNTAWQIEFTAALVAMF